MDETQKKLLLLERDRQFPQLRQSKKITEVDRPLPLQSTSGEGEEQPTQKRPNKDGQGGDRTPQQKKVKPTEIIDLTQSPGKDDERPPRRPNQLPIKDR